MIPSSNISVIEILAKSLVGLSMLMIVACGKIYVHDEFKKTVLSKSEEEVETSIGKPTKVEAGNPEQVTWIYYAKTIDIDNQNKRDAKTLVIFEPDRASGKLKVADVKFERG